MKKYCEDRFKYLKPGLFRNIDLKIYSDDRINILVVTNDFFEHQGLECYRFIIYFQEFSGESKVERLPEDEWNLLCRGRFNGVLFKKNVKIESELINLIDQLINEMTKKNNGYQYILQSLNIQILISLLRIITRNFKSYNRRLQAEKTLTYISTQYKKIFLENDINRNFNHNCYYIKENNELMGEGFTKEDNKINCRLNRLELLKIFCREIIFELKFKNNNYVNFYKFKE